MLFAIVAAVVGLVIGVLAGLLLKPARLQFSSCCGTTLGCMTCVNTQEVRRATASHIG